MSQSRISAKRARAAQHIFEYVGTFAMFLSVAASSLSD